MKGSGALEVEGAPSLMRNKVARPNRDRTDTRGSTRSFLCPTCTVGESLAQAGNLACSGPITLDGRRDLAPSSA